MFYIMCAHVVLKIIKIKNTCVQKIIHKEVYNDNAIIGTSR